MAEAERLAPCDEERLPAGVAVRPLGDRGERHALDAELDAITSRAASNWPLAAVDDDESGARRERRRRRPLFALCRYQPREAARQHLAHHRVVVARREVGAFDVEGPVGVFTKPSGPATTMAPTAFVPMMWELS